MSRKMLIAAMMFGMCGTGAGTLFAQAGPGTQSAPAGAQGNTQMSDQDIERVRKDLRAQKKQMVAANLTLTTDQATKFWPVYDQYIAEQTKIHDQKYAVIKEFGTSWGSIDDAKAMDLTHRALAVDQQVTQLRIKYVPIFSKVLPGKQVATFFQIDRRLQMVVDLQLMAQLPLVQAQ